eukprot:3934458-Amphidinium_carterae.1
MANGAKNKTYRFCGMDLHILLVGSSKWATGKSFDPRKVGNSAMRIHGMSTLLSPRAVAEPDNSPPPSYRAKRSGTGGRILI